MNNCSQCHGSDARGSKGFPNLTDGDWLHGGAELLLTMANVFTVSYLNILGDFLPVFLFGSMGTI